MDIETITVCPLGSQCREIKDNKMYVCAWLVKLKGTDATGEEHNDEKCSMFWQPILQIENAQQTRELSASVDSHRNENIIRQDTALNSIRLIDGLIKGAGNVKAISN